MPWKIEKWLSDVFPGKGEIYSAYHKLPSRELAVVGGGVLDLALAELISIRVNNIPAEYESFLGLDGSANAPAGTFGARIQLALLLGIITQKDAKILRIIKNIRNKFSHQININFCDQSVLPLLKKLLLAWQDCAFVLAEKNDWDINRIKDGFSEIEQYLDTMPEAGEGLFLAVFTIYHAYLHRLSELICRIKNIVQWENG
ncbi:MAG: hypothetical protein IH886_03290 [Nitrospinae bacterium]|nr:hypothetical protein [Nitrospinota bacterium]